jgi:Resolvase, N terminal domain
MSGDPWAKNVRKTLSLCWLVTCASHPNRIDRSQICNVTHCGRRCVDGGTLFEDHASGAKDDRLGLNEALTFVRPGEVLVVWKLDRLGPIAVTFAMHR